MARTHRHDLSVDNLGLQADYFLAENFYLSGQGLAAYSGKACVGSGSGLRYLKQKGQNWSN